MGKIASKIWSKGLLGGFGIPAMTKALEPLASWSRTDLIDAYQHFLDYCDETVDRHVSWTSLRWVYGEAISQATRPTISRSNRRWFSIIFRCQTNPCCCWYLIKSIKAHLSNCSKHIHISPQYIFQHHHFILATVSSKKNRNEIINITMSPGFSWIFMDFPLFSISPTPKVFQTSPVQAPSLRNPLRSPPVHSDIPRSSRMSSNASATPRKRTPPSRPWNPRRAAAMATRSLRRPWPRPIRASSPRWENFEMRGWRPWKPWGNQGEIKYINMEGELKHSKFFRWSSLIMMIRCLWQCFFQFTFLYYGTCGYRHL